MFPQQTVSVTRGDGCWRGQFQAMASECEVLCKTPHKIRARCLVALAAAEVWRIEDKFSRYRKDNIVHAINSARGKPVEVDFETAKLLDFADTLFEESDGRFDITSGVLRRVWRFNHLGAVPKKEAVQSALELVGWRKVTWDAPTLTMRPGMEIDFGGIGKEYAVDRAVSLLRKASKSSCLVNLGGDLAVTRESPDGRPWAVGITTALRGSPPGLLQLKVGALATSGDAFRFLVKDGRRYGHILDSLSGWPVENAARSITVAADTCTEAGMYSTLAMLQGEGAEDFLAAQQVDHWCDR